MIKTFFASEFRQNVAKILSANVISQAIGLLVYPLITRMYSPEEFGAFNVFMSICSVLFVLSTGRYESAVVQPKSARDAAAVFHLSLLITIGLSVLSVLLIFLFKPAIQDYFSLTSIGNGLYFLPLLVFFYGVGMIWGRWYNRFKEYGKMGRYQVVQSLTGNVFKILFGWCGHTRLGLLWATVLGYFLGFVNLLISKGERRLWLFLFDFRSKRISAMAREYSMYPRYTLPRAFANMLSMHLPVLLLTPYFGEKLIGFYALAVVVGFRPVNLISTSINQVLFQRVVEMCHQRKSIQSILLNFTSKALLFFFPLFVVLYFTLLPIVSTLFGSEWVETASLLQIQLPWIFTSIFTATMFFIPVVFFKQKQALIFELVFLFSRCLALWLGILSENFHLAVSIFSWVSVFMLLGQLVWFYLLLRRYEKSIQSTSS